MASHILPTRVYYTIFAILLFCTYLTVQIAFLDLGALNTVAALAIATFKAALVILFFMHVKYSTRLTWAVVLGGIFWLGILLTLTATDYLTPSTLSYAQIGQPPQVLKTMPAFFDGRGIRTSSSRPRRRTARTASCSAARSSCLRWPPGP